MTITDFEIRKETEKAILVYWAGMECWMPKSISTIDGNSMTFPRWKAKDFRYWFSNNAQYRSRVRNS